jgi:cellulose synthase operon protein C
VASRILTLAPTAPSAASAEGARPRVPALPPVAPGIALAIDKRGVGFALDAPLACGPLRIGLLESTIIGLRFPVDVSGGLARFRHRRSQLHVLQMEAEWAALETTLARATRGLLSLGVPSVRMSGDASSVRIALLADDPNLVADPRAALVFEATLEADGDDLRIYVHSARSIGAPLPATALAMRATAATLGALANQSGCMFHVPSLGRAAALAAFPAAGVRAPDAHGLRATRLIVGASGMNIRLEREGDGLLPSDRALRAAEEARLAQRGDVASMQGDWVTARREFLTALDRAPHHQGLLRRLAELDTHAGNTRTEVARSWLRELDPKEPLGGLGGALAAQSGDSAEAAAAYLHTASTETDACLATSAWEAAAVHAETETSRIEWLSRALAQSPDRRSARLQRLEAALRIGDLERAKLDLAHLEAACEPAQLYALRMRVGDRLIAVGAAEAARRLFERALRSAPDDAAALLGLGRCFVQVGAIARAATVFKRAIDVAEAQVLPTDDAHLALAGLLADDLGEPGAALARLRRISDDVPAAVAARILESKLRFNLGDFPAMRTAHLRLRMLVQRLQTPTAAEALFAAAELEWRISADAQLAHAHLEIALPFLGNRTAVTALARQLGTALSIRKPSARTEQPAVTPTEQLAPVEHPASVAESDSARVLGAAPIPSRSAEVPLLDTATLRRRVEADPANVTAVRDLAQRLEAEGEWLDLLSLSLARLDEDPGDAIAELVAFKYTALRQLAEDVARPASERELYRTMLTSAQD